MMRPRVGSGLLLLLPPLLLVAWLLVRRLGWLPKGRVLSSSAPLGNRVSHRAEALMLLCVATAIFVFTATNTSTGGRLLVLDQLRPGFATVNILAATAAAVGVLLGVLAAFFWRTSTGVILAGGILCIYATVLNGPSIILESLTPRESALPEAALTFDLTSPDVEGAELYINGVQLGTLPYETTYGEFHRKVPFWQNEPNELKVGNLRSWLHVPSDWHPGRSGPLTKAYPPWAEIPLPERWSEGNQRRFGLGADRKANTYYARVKLGEDWGYWQVHGGSSGISGRYGQRTAVVPMGFIFPNRQARIEKLLDIARLNDYAPPPEWFEVMETYRSDGWIAVRKAIDEEPLMLQVLDRWTVWKYGLDKATDAASAWRVFQRIRREADERQYYLTSDAAGRAVELLAARLDPEQLVRLAGDIVRSTQLYSWSSWQMNGREQFGTSFSSEGFRTGTDRVTSYSAGGRGDRRLSPSGFAVAHAIRVLDETLDTKDDTQSNIVERELVPTFIAYHYRNMNLLRLATHIGGPAMETYLLRQDWRADPADLPWHQQMRIGGQEVNGWLYLLAHLQSPTGREFRQEHTPHLMDMADRLTERMWDLSWERCLSFLFLDLDRGANSLALRYWPRFKSAANPEGHEALSHQLQYLLRMEPLSAPGMYVQCWRAFRGDVGFDMALDEFGEAAIPYDKRRRIYTALADSVGRDVSNVDSIGGRDADATRRRLLAMLQERLLPITDEARAGDLLAALQAGDSKYKPENVADWLAHAAPGHPLVGMLAQADEPSLRLLVMGALREHPTPANREILDKLLADDDEQVRRAAQRVKAELDEMRAMSVATLSAGGPEQ